MDLTAVRQEVSNWPVAERLNLIERVWDDMVSCGEHPEVTEVQAAEIDRRVQWLDANPDKTESWDEVEAYLRNSK